MELMSSPDTPKSQILISPLELHKMFEGLISTMWTIDVSSTTTLVEENKLRTTMNNPMHIIQIRQALEHRQRDLAHNINLNRANLLVYPVQRALVHELHADADVGVRYERAVERDDALRFTVVHNL